MHAVGNHVYKMYTITNMGDAKPTGESVTGEIHASAGYPLTDFPHDAIVLSFIKFRLQTAWRVRIIQEVTFYLKRILKQILEPYVPRQIIKGFQSNLVYNFIYLKRRCQDRCF